MMTAAKETTQIVPGDFIDLCAFFFAADAFRMISLFGDTKTEVAPENEKHLKSAITLIRRFQPAFIEGMTKYLAPLTGTTSFEKFDARLKVAMRPGVSFEHVADQVEVLGQIFSLLKSRPTMMKTTFPDTRAVSKALRIAVVVSGGAASPETVLNGIAALPTISKSQPTVKWAQKAALIAGVPPSTVEKAIADAGTATEIGRDIQTTEAKLNNLDSNSVEAVELQEHKQQLLANLSHVVSESASPSATLAAGVAAAASQDLREYQTKTGRNRKLNPDKEKAMMIRGRGIIAAGAGAGKTLTLASKVVYHINELGVPATSVIATSFSKKSAAELIARITKYGADISDSASKGFSTTHKIASFLMSEFGGQKFMNPLDRDQAGLVRIAMEQVQMGPLGIDPPSPTSIFEGLLPGYNETTGEVVSAPGTVPVDNDIVGLSFKEAITAAYNRRAYLNSWLQGFLVSFFDRTAQWYPQTMRATKNLTDPRGLSGKQQDYLLDAFDRTGVQYRLDTDPVLNPGLAKMPRPKVAAKSKEEKEAAQKRTLARKYPDFFTKPANQWFNLGLDLTDPEKKEPMQPGVFLRAITKFKGKLVSPSEAWAQNPTPEAAVYAAYEWLKGPTGEMSLRGKTDFDDGLIAPSKLMLRSPKALKEIQARFKVILVDEAQDLNRAQHVMFGLMAGYLDPKKVKNIGTARKISELANDDGSMTADTYCLIGDDKQAIYEFRGADPEAFIDMSDLVEGGAGFKTETLLYNYRSGREIVDAANRLITFNKKQIPMKCLADPDRKNKGAITTIHFPPIEGYDVEEPAKWMADRIEEAMANGEGGAKGYDAFGVGVRSNAEAYAYGIELLKKGIPFRSKANFFNDATTKALLNWLVLADEGDAGDTDRINSAVMNARKVPTTFLGDAFEQEMSLKATGNYLTWLQANWAVFDGTSSNKARNIKSFVDNLTRVAGLKEAGLSSEQVLSELMSMTGADGESVEDTLVSWVENNDKIMAEIMAEAPEGKVTAEAIRQVAMAPISPLMGLLGARANLTEALKYVRQLQDANSKLASDDSPEAKGFKQPAVTIGTMHSWKGLEVENMFIPFVGGRFPRDTETEEELASSRRLAYVAVTRGENHVYVMDIPSVRKTKTGMITSKSRFVTELQDPCDQVQTPVADEKPDALVSEWGDTLPEAK